MLSIGVGEPIHLIKPLYYLCFSRCESTAITQSLKHKPKDKIKKLDPVKLQSLSLATIGLPDILRNNLYDFLENFNPRELSKDADVLSQYLRNRNAEDPLLTRTTTKVPKLASSQSQIIEKLADTYGLTQILEEINKQLEYDSGKPRKRERKKLALLSYQPRECAAFAAGRTQGIYGSTLRVFNEIHSRDPSFAPSTILDYGSGLGMTYWAANSIWNQHSPNFHCIEVSDYMVDLSIRLNRYREEDKDYIKNVSYSAIFPTDKMFDLVVASYTLTEFPIHKLRHKVLKSLWDVTKKYLVIIDHGNVDGFNAILAARKLIEEDESPNKGSIFAPCPQDTFCPRSVRYTKKYMPCTFSQRVQLAFYEGNRKRLGFSNEHFSYIVLLKGEKPGEATLPRVVSPIVKFKGFLTCEMCTKHCQIVRHNFSRNKDPDVYKSIKTDIMTGDILCLPSRNYDGYKRVVIPLAEDDDRHARRLIENVVRKIDSKTQHLLQLQDDLENENLPIMHPNNDEITE